MQKCEFKNEYHGGYHIITIYYYILHLFFSFSLQRRP